MPYDGRDFYKTAFVVPDLVEAARRMGAVQELDWLEPQSVAREYRIGDEIRVLTMRHIITRQTPRIHLLAEISGTPWSASPSGAAHHIAYWVEDIVAATDRLLSVGWRVECCDANASVRPTIWGYFISPDGLRVELIDRQGLDDPAQTFLDGFNSFSVSG